MKKLSTDNSAGENASGKKPNLIVDWFDAWGDSVTNGEPPKMWLLHPDKDNLLNQFSLRPQTVVVLGGSPGAGKTAFLIETIYKALTLDQELKALIVNVEMSHEQLLDRLLASQSCVPLADIIDRKRTPENLPLLQTGLEKIQAVTERLGFLGIPFTIEKIKEAVDYFGAQIIVLDYTQRIRIEGDVHSAKDKINILMDEIRELAKGRCVIAVSALSRQSGNERTKSHNVGMSAFRDSSEFEYAADDCWILDTNLNKVEAAHVAYGTQMNRVLRCLKKRSGMPQNINFYFDGAFQRFIVNDGVPNKNAKYNDYFDENGGDTELAADDDDEGGFIE